MHIKKEYIEESKQHVFIIGSKGIPGAYGGYETFLDKLTEYHQDERAIQYHIACKGNVKKEFSYHNAHCFCIKVPNIGSAQAIYYDVASFNYCCRYIKKHRIKHPIIYILACRVGPFAYFFKQRAHSLHGTVYVNPDGHEWMRAKWAKPIRKYWKYSETLMTKHADLLICDSKNIEKYIQKEYEKYHPKTIYIAYGAEVRKSYLQDDAEKLKEWYQKHQLESKSYYLVVGRFVPENNYETMIREFMNSCTAKSFALITNVSDKFLEELKSKTRFDKDSRIKFVGTVFDQELLMKIRENAFGYFHGHEVGGTNPSLLEALGATDLNLLLDVGFNRECAEEGALYWTKEPGNLKAVIEKADKLTKEEVDELGRLAHKRIEKWYSWEYISEEYKKLFLEKCK